MISMSACPSGRAVDVGLRINCRCELRRIPLTIAILTALVPFARAVTRFAIVDIGLANAEHTRNDGVKLSDVNKVTPNRLQVVDGVVTVPSNEAGEVIGTSNRYNGGANFLGTSAWLYNGSKTLNIGLTDAEHTGTGSLRSSSSLWLNGAGQAVGSSARFNGGANGLGNSAWLYDGSSTIAVGLTDADHTRSDGRRETGVEHLNEHGQAIGLSQRYNNGSSYSTTSQDAWVYDPNTGDRSTSALAARRRIFLQRCLVSRRRRCSRGPLHRIQRHDLTWQTCLLLDAL